MKNIDINAISAVNGGCWEFCNCFCKKRIVYISDYCQNAKIIYISKADVLTDETMRQIYANNELYEKMCVNDKTAIL